MRLLHGLFGSLLFVLLFAGVSGATGFIEPLSPVDEYRQEIGFYHSEADLEAQDESYSDLTLKQNSLYFQIEYPVEESLSLYARLGAANADLTVDVPRTVTLAETFEGKYRPWGGVGLKATLGTNPNVNLAWFIEGNYYARYSDQIDTLKLEFEKYWDVTAGLALQLQFKGVGAYVGPVGYFSNAALQVTDTTTGVRDSGFYRNETQGIRAGVKFPFSSLAYLSLDGIFGDRTVVGGCLNIVGFDL